MKRLGINFIVFASKENHWVIKPFVKVKIIDSFFPSMLEKLLIFFRNLLTIFRKQDKKNFKIFFDLKGDLKLSQHFCKKGYFCIHCKNLLLNLCCSDYVINDFYSTFGKKQLLEKYLEFFRNAGIQLQIEEFPKEVEEYIKKVHSPKADKILESLEKFSIVFVGNKPFRNFRTDEWKVLIEKGLKYEGTILIVDDPSFKVLPYLKENLTRENVKFLEEKLDLWSLMYVAKFADWVLGIDGGGFNFLQMPTNAYQINFYTDVETWKPFSLNPYRVEDSFKNVILISSITSQNKRKKVLFVNDSKKVFCEKLEKECDYVKRNLLEYILEKKIKLE
ncbi:MAG: hypothetical protein ABGX27_07555 [Desulfurobacteriaceae bacterium]